MLYRAIALGLLMAGPALADDVTTFTLENGLDVVVIEDNRAPVVTQMIWYRVGSADEQPGKSGIAHFFEHLMFKGTNKIEAGQFSNIVQSQGGSDNAFTYYDYTAYFQRVAVDRLDLVMDMESNRMRNLRLTDNDVATERDVVLEERNTLIDSDPTSLMAEQMNAALYLNHPYGTPVIGWRHEISNLNRQDSLDFYQRYYAPNNAILVIAGNVDPETIKSKAEKYYGPLKPTADIPERLRPQEPPQRAERRLVLQHPQAAEASIQRKYVVTPRKPGDQKEAAALTLLAELLGGSKTTSLLAKALLFGENPLAVATFANYDGDRVDDGVFTLTVIPAGDVAPEDAEAAMDGVLEQFLQDGPDLNELARIQKKLRAAVIYDRDTSQAQADQYGQALTIGLGIRDVQEWNAVLAAVTPEDVKAAAKAALNRDRSVTGYLIPSTEEAAQ